MKKKSIISLLLVGVLTIGGSVFAYASSNQGNGGSGATYVQKLVNDGLTLEEARATALNTKLEKIDAQVQNGALSQEEGNSLKDTIQTNYENCDGSNYQNQSKENKTGKMLGVNKNQSRNGKNNADCQNNQRMNRKQNCDNSCMQN